MFLCHANKQMYDLLLQVRVSIEPSNMQLSLILLDWRRVKSNAKGTLNNKGKSPRLRSWMPGTNFRSSYLNLKEWHQKLLFIIHFFSKYCLRV